MAHIIALMDETLQAVPPDFTRSPEHRAERRTMAVRTNIRAVPHPFAGDENASGTDAAPRMDRVNALRTAIANGTYSVSAADLAEKILHTMLRR